ncbi:hypothetical protein BGZ49_006304, partial [Haplosporangium sp. Z 27]
FYDQDTREQWTNNIVEGLPSERDEVSDSESDSETSTSDEEDQVPPPPPVVMTQSQREPSDDVSAQANAEDDPVIWEYGSDDEAMEEAQQSNSQNVEEDRAEDNPNPVPEVQEEKEPNNQFLNNDEILRLDPNTAAFAPRLKETHQQRSARKEKYIQTRLLQWWSPGGRNKETAANEFEAQEARLDQTWLLKQRRGLMAIQETFRQQIAQ